MRHLLMPVDSMLGLIFGFFGICGFVDFLDFCCAAKSLRELFSKIRHYLISTMRP